MRFLRYYLGGVIAICAMALLVGYAPPSQSGEREMTLKAGVAKVDITPPVGGYMAGSLRKRVSKTIGTPLYAKALVLDNGETQIGFLALDLFRL